MITIKDIYLAWRDAALYEWAKNVKDVDRSPFITRYFEEVGWSPWIRSHYENNRRNAWCGIFAGYCGLHLSRFLLHPEETYFALDHDLARIVFPSTARIVSQAKWKASGASFPKLLKTRDILEKPDTLRPGMVATVKTKKGPQWGGHIVIIDDIDLQNKTFSSIEGNGWGELADGTYGEGVVRRRGKRARTLDEICVIPLMTYDHFDSIPLPSYVCEYDSLKA